MEVSDGVLYSFEIVGGPWDGAPGLSWFDDGEHETPAHIFVGRCPGDSSCGALHCGRSRRLRPHVAYWTEPERDEAPRQTVKYFKHEEHVRRVEEDDAVLEFTGTTAYMMGGLDFLGRAERRELVPAGASTSEPGPVPVPRELERARG